MLKTVVLLFALAALGGLMLATLRFRNKDAPWPLAILHLLLAAAGLFTASLIIRIGSGPLSPTQEIAGLVVEGIGVAVLLIGGWLGGELVFRHRIGGNEDVNSPKP